MSVIGKSPSHSRISIQIPVSKMEDTFTSTVSDLHSIVVLDSIREVPPPADASSDDQADPPEATASALPHFLIQSHDLYGPLPEIRISLAWGRNKILDTITRETTKLTVINDMRRLIAADLKKCEFLPHTVLDDGVLVGVRWKRGIELVEARNFLEAYKELGERF